MGNMTESKVKLVAAKDLIAGMKMDWESDKYADPDSDNTLSLMNIKLYMRPFLILSAASKWFLILIMSADFHLNTWLVSL